jgi:hypothetical protein
VILKNCKNSFNTSTLVYHKKAAWINMNASR